VRWFSHTDTYSYARRYTDAYSCSHADTFAYSNAHTYSCSDPNAHRYTDAYSRSHADSHACRNANTDPNAHSVTCAQLLNLDQSSVGESSADRRNCHLYRDNYADERLQFPD
jgi:hypothetical protein